MEQRLSWRTEAKGRYQLLGEATLTQASEFIRLASDLGMPLGAGLDVDGGADELDAERLTPHQRRIGARGEFCAFG